MRVRTLAFLATAALLLMPAQPARAEAPSAEELLSRVLDAAGGQETFAKLGVLELGIDEEETRADASSASRQLRAYASTVRLEYLRLEMDNGLTVVREADSGWATVAGKLDDRQQTPRMARGTVHQRLLPLLLPFSLTMQGLELGRVSETTFEDVPAWRVDLILPVGFFASPAINRTWQLYVSRADSSLIAAQYQPPPEYTTVVAEGIRYRILDTQEVGGLKLPRRILMEGISAEGELTGHTRAVKVVAAVRGPWDSTLFLNPKTLEAMDEGDVLE